MRWIVPSLLLAAFAALAIGSMATESVTGDEVAHLPSGYTYVTTGDFRLNPQHPPLIKALAALPLLSLDLKAVEGSPGWDSSDEWSFGRDFLVNNQVPTADIIFRARLPMVAVGVLGGALLFGWAVELWGYWPGVFVLLLYVLCPNFLAHTALVTTDVGVTTFTVATLYALWKFAQAPRLRYAVWCGVALGLTLLAKYSGVVTVALVAVLLPAAVLFAPAGDAAGAAQWRRAVIAAIVIAALPALLIAVGFGAPHGLANYWHGFRIIHADLNPHWEAFLWGQYSPTGFWYYYLLAQWWKTPIPTLLCFGASLFLIAAPDRRALRNWLFILLPFAAFHAAGMLFRSSIGVRHILPAYPFLFLACGAVAQRIGRRGFVHRAVFAVLCLWLTAGTLRMYPRFLPYFNELAGGPAHGIDYLDDSNIEWGQDLGGVKTYIDAHQLTNVRISAFKAFRPERYGITYEFMRLRDVVWPEPGVTYFVGASYLQRSSLYNDYPGVRFQWLKRYAPIDTIGGSIYVYRFSTDAADATRPGVISLPAQRWYDDAIRDLNAMISRAPQFAEARQVQTAVYRSRAAWHEVHHDVEGAALDFLRVSQTEPQMPAPRLRFRELLPRWRASLTVDEQVPASHYYAEAFVADQQGRVEEALRSYLLCLKRDPNHLGALFNLGQLYARLGFPRLAQMQWQQCLAIDPGYTPAQESLRHSQQAPPGVPGPGEGR